MNSNRVKVLHKWLFWIWICPGLPLSFYLRNQVAWVVFMSWYAIVGWHANGFRQEEIAP